MDLNENGKEDLQEVVDYVEKKTGLTEKSFLIICSVATIVLLYLATNYFYPETQNPYGAPVRITASGVHTFTMWAILSLAFTYFLKGLKYDLLDQVFNQKNTAAAILLGFAWLSIAISMH